MRGRSFDADSGAVLQVTADREGGHDQGGVDHPGVAEQVEEQAGGYGRGKDVDQIVAEEDRAYHPLGELDELLEEELELFGDGLCAPPPQALRISDNATGALQ